MGLLDNIKDAADKVEDLAADHKDQVEQGIDKAADAIEKKVGHGDQIDKATEAGKGFVEKLTKD